MRKMTGDVEMGRDCTYHWHCEVGIWDSRKLFQIAKLAVAFRIPR